MTRTVGVEEEFLVLRRDGNGPADDGEDVARAAARADRDGQFEHELKRSQVELGSAPTASIVELRKNLVSLRRELAHAANGRGSRLIASGSAPHIEDARVTDEHRYRAMTQSFGLVARKQLTCGMHVHISVESRDEGVRVLDRLTAWLPLFTALAANSPYYGGEDSGYSSYRSVLWGQWPTAGPVGTLGDVGTYDRLVDDLIALGAARDTGMIYFDARLSATYPTVEIRVCDVCPTVDVATTIAALARALIETLAAATSAHAHRPELVRAAAWRAARDGMSGELVDLTGDRPRLRPAWDLATALTEFVAPALRASGDHGFVLDGVKRLRLDGTGAQRQRSVHARRGSIDDVLDSLTVG